MSLRTLAEITERFNELRIMIPSSIRTAYPIDDRYDTFTCTFSRFFRREENLSGEPLETRRIILKPYFSFREKVEIKINGVYGILGKTDLVQHYGFLAGEFVEIHFEELNHYRPRFWWPFKTETKSLPIFPARLIEDIPGRCQIMDAVPAESSRATRPVKSVIPPVPSTV